MTGLKAIRPLSEPAIVKALAQHVCDELVHKIIADLEALDYALLSGDDSGLQNAWDEICIEIQYQYSFAWEAYDHTARSIAGQYVDTLITHEREAVWLQTSEGADWKLSDEDDREPYPVIDNEIVDYVLDRVYSVAADWTNERITAYIDRRYEYD